MQHFSNTPTVPLTTSQANQSRLVIKKTYQYFDKTIENTTIPYMFEDFWIACASKPKITSEMDELITLQMLSFPNEDSAYYLLVREENLNGGTSYFWRIEVLEIDFFPRLDNSQFHLCTCSNYQIKMARSYYADHLNEAKDFEF